MIKGGLIALMINLMIGGCTTEYIVEYWASLIKQTPVDISFIPAIIVGMFFGTFTIPAAAITWIISMVASNPYYIPN